MYIFIIFNISASKSSKNNKKIQFDVFFKLNTLLKYNQTQFQIQNQSLFLIMMD